MSQKKDTPESDTRQEETVAHLVRHGGRRANPPAHIRKAVYASTEAAWQQSVQAHRQRQHTQWRRAAAVLIVGGIGIFMALQSRIRAPGPSVAVATVMRVNGTAQYARDAKQWAPLIAGMTVAAGNTLRTLADGRAALTLSSGHSLRLDQRTQVSLHADRTLALAHGAVYVDSAMALTTPADGGLRVSAGGLSVREIGTQFEVRSRSANQLSVQVREGQVEVRSTTGNRAQPTDARAGERITFSDGALLERTAVRADDKTWDWVQAVVPTYQFDGKSLRELLHWVERETGMIVVFKSEQARVASQQAIVTGSLDGWSPIRTLDTVILTTRLRYAVEDGKLVIDVRP